MKPIRVLQVLTIMNVGGAETMIMNYYRNIDRTKVQFDFLLHRQEKGYFDEEILSLGGHIYKLCPITPFNYFNYIKELNAFFDKHKEFYIVHSHLNALSSIILSVAKKKNIPFRIAHSHLAVEPSVLKKIFKKNTDIKATLKDYLQTLIRPKILNSANIFFACGEKAGVWLYGKNHQFKIVNNAINATKYKYDYETRKNLKKKLGLEGKKVIGHIGRFNEQKNHYFLIKIFNEIFKKDKNSILLLIGEGNLKDKIMTEAEKLKIHQKIRFMGLRTDIPELLQCFDIFLFPSLYEGLPVTLIEAQASGLRVITSTTVTTEVDITGLITYVDLRKSESVWAEIVLNKINYIRENTLEGVIKGGFDISSNAKNLQEFYLSKSLK